MKQKLSVVLLLLALTITACGMNPAEKLEEAAAEQIAETIIEQASGIDDIEINTEDGSVSYTVEDENGDSSTFSSSAIENVNTLEGMGFNIQLPDGVGNGTVQHMEENGEDMVTSGVFEVDGLTLEQFYNGLHPTLTDAGFIFIDLSQSGKTAPDTSDPINSMMVSYEHPDGVTFSALWGDTDVILGLTKVTVTDQGNNAGSANEAAADSSESSGTDGAADVDPASFDGSINTTKTQYALNEAIVIALTINTPLADNAWVGIVPSDTPHGSETENDAVDVAYAYVYEAQDGTITLNAPSEVGNYDVRLFSTDDGGVELDSVFIIVGE